MLEWILKADDSFSRNSHAELCSSIPLSVACHCHLPSVFLVARNMPSTTSLGITQLTKTMALLRSAKILVEYHPLRRSRPLGRSKK